MLTIHKNTKRQRDSKRVRKGLISSAKNLANTQDISGYVVFVWSDGQGSRCEWDTSRSNIPGSLVGEHAKQTINRIIAQDDVSDILNGGC